MKNKNIGIALGIVCFVLATTLTLQIRTMTMENSFVKQNFANEELKDSLLKWKEKYDKSVEQLSISSKQLETIRETATTNASNSEEKTKQ